MQPRFSSLIRTLVSVSFIMPLITTVPAAAQVRAPGNEKPLPESALKAPPFQQSGNGETGPRIFFGTFVNNPTGVAERHNGFSVLCEPAGARGTSFSVSVSDGFSDVVGFVPGLFAGQWILIGDDPATPAIEGRFYQIASIISVFQFTLTQPYVGPSGPIAAKRETLLFTTCNVTLDEPVGGTVVISARGNQPAPGEQFLPGAMAAQIEQGAGPMPSEGTFQVFLMSPGFPPHNPGGTGTIDFIVIGN